MTKLPFALAAIGALAFSAAASAATMEFSEVDADQSGDLTQEEVTAAIPDWTEEQFSSLDADASGTLDEEEYAAAPEEPS